MFRSLRRPGLALVAVLCVLLITACGSDPGPSAPPAGGDGAGNGSDGGAGGGGGAGGDGGAAAPGPCDLTEPAIVAEVFGGSVDSEVPGMARNCNYAVSGGAAETVSVFYYGTAAEWDGIRGGYEDNRGPLTDVSGVGDAAYHPGDVGDLEIVVRAGDVVFAVAVTGGSDGPGAAPNVRDLAVRIAGDLM